jgi:hypothetical protein
MKLHDIMLQMVLDKLLAKYPKWNIHDDRRWGGGIIVYSKTYDHLFEYDITSSKVLIDYDYERDDSISYDACDPDFDPEWFVTLIVMRMEGDRF